MTEDKEVLNAKDQLAEFDQNILKKFSSGETFSQDAIENINKMRKLLISIRRTEIGMDNLS